MKMMLPDVIGHENQSQHYQHHLCLCLDLSGRIITPYRFSYHTGRSMNLRVASYRLAADESSPRLNLVTYDAQIHYIDEDRTHTPRIRSSLHADRCTRRPPIHAYKKACEIPIIG